MAYDGIITYGITEELKERLTFGKIEKVYQPGSEELVLQIHTRKGNVKLYASAASQAARVCLTDGKFVNPAAPPNFCMLLRKHIQTGRITDIHQRGSERIIEMDIEAQTELGFTVSKRLIFEIMGKHSNIVLVALDTGKIIDSIKRISIDVNRYRQLLPGLEYRYPPKQDKVPFKEISTELSEKLDSDPEAAADPKYLLSHKREPHQERQLPHPGDLSGVRWRGAGAVGRRHQSADLHQSGLLGEAGKKIFSLRLPGCHEYRGAFRADFTEADRHGMHSILPGHL